ncbi:MAG: GntR family transcriptional regulator [Sulfitobacter sp.]
MRPIKRDLLADQAAAELRRLIVVGSIAPGQQVTERELSSVLGISRTPIREAMRTLALEGLLKASDTGRYFAADPSVDEICDLLRVIGVLEGLAGRLTCETASDADLERIAGLQQKMRQFPALKENLKYFETNIDFHLKIVAASKNDELVRTHKMLNDRLYRVRYLCSKISTNRSRAMDEHDQIVTALLARDGTLVEQYLRGHMAQAEINVAQTFAETAQ